MRVVGGGCKRGGKVGGGIAGTYARTLRRLFRGFGVALFADDGDFDDAGVLEFVFDSLADRAGDFARFLVVDFRRANDDADFATRLDGVGFQNAGQIRGDLFEAFEALEVVALGFGAGTGAGGGKGVCGNEETGVNAFGGDFLVVGGDGVDDCVRFAVGAEEIAADEGVAAFVFFADGFADVVEKAGAFRDDRVETDFGSEHGGKEGDFDGVVEDVLVEGIAVFEAAENGEDFVVDAGQIQAVDGFLAVADDFGVDAGLGLGEVIFDAGGVDASVLDEAFEGDFGDFAADGIEAGNEEGIGGFVDQQSGAGDGFEAFDVAAFAPDDAALHVLAGEADGGGGDIALGAACDALHRGDEEGAGLVLDLFFGTFEEFAAVVPDFVLAFAADFFEELFFGVFGGKLADHFEFSAVEPEHVADRLAALFEGGGFAFEFFAAGFEVGGDLGGGFLPVGEIAFAVFGFDAVFVFGAAELCPASFDFDFGFAADFAGGEFGFFAGVVEGGFGFFEFELPVANGEDPNEKCSEDGAKQCGYENGPNNTHTFSATVFGAPGRASDCRNRIIASRRRISTTVFYFAKMGWFGLLLCSGGKGEWGLAGGRFCREILGRSR